MTISGWRIGFRLRVTGVDGREHRWGSFLSHLQAIRTGKGRQPTCLVLIPYLVPATDYYWIGNLKECTRAASEEQI